MSKRFTKKSGIQVELTDEHLDTAIEIYQELSKLSPSGRVSWAKLTSMMHDSGFEDAENSEAYRQAIKFERKKRGVLPSAEKLADLASENLLNAIKEEIGNLKYHKQEAQDSSLTLSRLKRELSRKSFMYEHIDNQINNLDLSYLNDLTDVDIRYEDEDTICVITFNDLHYGWLPHTEHDTKVYYQGIINKYLSNIVKFGNDNFVNKFIVVNQGDMIESNLRPSSLHSGNELAVQQIVTATELLFDFLVNLRGNGFEVDYLPASKGNHERINPNKNHEIDGEDYFVVHKALIKSLLKNTNINYIEPTDHFYSILDVYGVKMFLSHGDRHNIKSDNILSSLSEYHDKLFDIVMFGHLHSLSISEVGDNRYKIITGSLKGPDDYSAKINKKSCRSQVGILINSNGEFDIRQIKI